MPRYELQYPNLLGKGLGTMQNRRLRLPPGCLLDISDSDVLILRRPDGSPVAAFSARGADPTELRRAAEEDRRNLAERDKPLPGMPGKTWRAATLRAPQRGTSRRH